MKKSSNVRKGNIRSQGKNALNDGNLTIEKLEAICGTRNLQSLQQLEVSFDSRYMSSLDSLFDYLPNLKRLILDDTNVKSIRDLGVKMKQLTMISLARMGLQDLDGMSIFSNLIELRCCHNHISDLTPLVMHESLQVLDVSYNQICDTVATELLGTCENLYSLDFRKNPLEREYAENKSMYYQVICFHIPQLQILDGRHVSKFHKTGNKTATEEDVLLASTASTSSTGIKYQETVTYSNIPKNHVILNHHNEYDVNNDTYNASDLQHSAIIITGNTAQSLRARKRAEHCNILDRSSNKMNSGTNELNECNLYSIDDTIKKKKDADDADQINGVDGLRLSKRGNHHQYRRKFITNDDENQNQMITQVQKKSYVPNNTKLPSSKHLLGSNNSSNSNDETEEDIISAFISVTMDYNKKLNIKQLRRRQLRKLDCEECNSSSSSSSSSSSAIKSDDDEKDINSNNHDKSNKTLATTSINNHPDEIPRYPNSILWSTSAATESSSSSSDEDSQTQVIINDPAMIDKNDEIIGKSLMYDTLEDESTTSERQYSSTATATVERFNILKQRRKRN